MHGCLHNTTSHGEFLLRVYTRPTGDCRWMYAVVGYILETSPVCTVRVTMPERYAFQLYLPPAPKGLPRVYSNPDGTLGQGLPLKQNRSPRRSHPPWRTLLVLPLCQDFDLCGAQSEISRSIKLTRRRYGGIPNVTESRFGRCRQIARHRRGDLDRRK